MDLTQISRTLQELDCKLNTVINDTVYWNVGGDNYKIHVLQDSLDSFTTYFPALTPETTYSLKGYLTAIDFHFYKKDLPNIKKGIKLNSIKL